ncbi:hypothetical protein CLAFUW4_01427 [Fulvia fulva]|uniref:Uncharacterized protein n=1 Tax=Passalora fulva TaxID=5499 RepID=A0A9Q8L8T2_PASFU|nr:uncharacterized protein CLAFUR5_01429 [Fulvia fulva]KAK4635181.1 hypothetical protein CLAFUR4_01428 [Fulvia fulva]KAK4638378.1 hypothetical protein CLAFUR0_01429 [Fulvia fulva]UJO13025.1 hypothetical protein CLAFUR5_01429 [Fulvia fulva]WPV09143.1 hypothetical protein CLAFUW4_01427 [Fulvia fulva]WPV25019.1 hypothetical protein CLAFUW7_01432 [Fulvia fulva]
MSASSVYSTSSSTTSSSTYSTSHPLLDNQRKSSLSKVIDKARGKLSGSEKLPNDESDFERAKAKELEKQRRKEEYERLGLGERTKFGQPGAGSFKAL